ncbi:heavy-metal-associated domain-containing protein [Limnobacter sp.]|uniref:heavy-metal-associated domain-containing protein n=1 Tax=Limnobacter sp. TaxID=2003368 RepID=UPI0035175A94
MITLQVEKMKCGGCAANVKQTVLSKDPQAEIDVDLANKQVKVQSCLDAQMLAKLITEAGYPAKPGT